MKRPILTILIIVSITGLCSCLVGPKYSRPLVTTPTAYRDADPVVNRANSVGDLKWAEVFQDDQLKALIAEALRTNYNVRIAAQRILEQQARVGIKRAQGLPSVSGGAAYDAIGVPSKALGTDTASRFQGGGLTAYAAWNLDFWGLYRRQNESERAQLLATEWGQRATMSSLVMQVAESYIQMRTLDGKLDLTQKTILDRRESLRLTRLRESVGSTTMADVSQAEQLLYTAEANIPDFERQIREHENDISLLLGRNPGPIARGKKTSEQPHPQDVTAGIPSQLLERRPDIRQAEAKLIAANADIGVARAQFFPQFSITGLGGTATSNLTKLVSPDSAYWLASGSLSVPIFTAGKLMNNLRLSRATEKEMVLTYQQTIAGAFHDVSNALIDYRKYTENRIALEKQVGAARESVRLARMRYDNGNTSYLEVLTNDTNLFDAQLKLASSEQPEALSLIQLYDSLGGGWQ